MAGTLLYGMILFDLIEGKYYIGGPEINIALHMAFRGEKPTLVSCVGDDELGRVALKMLEDHGISTEFVKIDPEHETGKVIVTLDSKGNPTFNLLKQVAYDYISLTETQYEKLTKNTFDFLYFGSNTQREEVGKNTARELIRRASYKHAFCDINLRKGVYTSELIEYCLSHSDILKLNNHEIIEIANLYQLGTSDEQVIIDWLFKNYRIEFILLTRGEDGATVFTHTGRQDFAGIKVDVKDTVGAGDGFSAGFMMEYAKSGNLMLAAQRGNELGAFVASKTGAVPEIEEE